MNDKENYTKCEKYYSKTERRATDSKIKIDKDKECKIK